MNIQEVFRIDTPITPLKSWLSEAEAAGLPEPTAMTLATVGKNQRPSARTVLFKGISNSASGREGIQFHTHYESRKSRELSENSWAATVFFWPQMKRQIRLEGRVERLSKVESDRYFESRPRGSQIGAWSSPQSQKIGGREELMAKVAETERRFEGKAVPRPENWGGWLLVPEAIEFWQAGEFRLHDRALFSWDGQRWHCSRLAP